MARPRYKAEKRARELRKQAERARKLARKHGKVPGQAEESAATPPEQPAAGMQDKPEGMPPAGP